MAIIKIKKNALINIITFVFFFICSGSQFGIENARYTDIIFLICTILLFTRCGNYQIANRNIVPAVVFSLILALNYLFYIGDSPNTAGYISYLIRMFSAFFLCSSIDFEDFKQKFIKGVSIIAVISLIVYGLRYMQGGAGYETMFGLFRTVVVNGTVRNAGIFWEPGAYQVFLNLALFLTLQKYNFKMFGSGKTMRQHLWLLILFVVGIISTFSTTGYLLLMINIVTLYLKNYKSMRRTQKVALGFPLFIAMVVVLYLVINTDTLIGKFTGTGNYGSTITRMADLEGSIEIIKHNLLGLGHGTRTWYETYARYRILNNSTGLLAAVCSMGIFFGVYYVYRIMRYSRYEIKNAWLSYALLVLCAGMSENFYFYPIYFVMLYSFKNRVDSEVIN